MDSQKCDTFANHEPSQGRGRTAQSKMAIAGVIALVAGGLCTIHSFVVGHATYTTSRAQQSAALISVAAGLAAFLFLCCAWCTLRRNGKVYAMIIGISNMVQVVPTIVYVVRIIS